MSESTVVEMSFNNTPIKIEAHGARGAGGDRHFYSLTGFDTADNICAEAQGYRSNFSRLPIVFQHGAPVDGKFNGVTMEALLTVCAHRLGELQAGPFPAFENGEALYHIGLAINWLDRRTSRFLNQRPEPSDIDPKSELGMLIERTRRRTGITAREALDRYAAALEKIRLEVADDDKFSEYLDSLGKVPLADQPQ